MRDRWLGRPEPAPGEGVVYWHILMRDYRKVVNTAATMQQVLARFPGLHMTPCEWLHVTTMNVGPSVEISRNDMSLMVEAAQRGLANTAPIPTILEKVIYHPEAIMLRVQPADALRPILEATKNATRLVIGREGVIGEPPSNTWTPHATVAYSTSNQVAGPIISALGKSVIGCEAQIDSVSLVIQWGPEPDWNWEPVGTARLLGNP